MKFSSGFLRLYEELSKINDLSSNRTFFTHLVNELSKFDYAFIDGDGNELPDDEAMKAVVQSPEQLVKLGKGVCTDLVEYTRMKLDERSIPYWVYDIQCTDKDGDHPAHVFVVVKDAGKFLWLEAAWHSEAGIHEYNSLEDLFEDIARKHCIYDGENYLDTCEIREIKKSLAGMSQEATYDYVDTLPIVWKATEERLTEEFDPSLLESADENTLSIEGVSSPEELMDWMKENISYELANDEYGAEDDPPTKTAKEVLDTKTGHCAEQSYLEKEVLEGLGYETFLVMVKENNSKKDYGADGSAHVFLIYKEGKNYCWFEHSMQSARGIHKYNSLKALLQDVANRWRRYDKNSDILEVRIMDKPITGVDNWGLAKECYKLPVDSTFDISDNIMESDVPSEEEITEEFDPPYNEQQVRDNYGEETYRRLIKDPAHLWRMRTGIELIHKEPSKDELERIWANWQLMSDKQKLISDKKSIQLFGKTNAENYNELIKLYEDWD